MKRIILFLAIVTFGLFVTSLPQPTAASNHWPPLLNCSDVNADGGVTIGDIGLVVGKFGTFYPNADYLLLYDVNGGGGVTVGDITRVVMDFGLECPLIDTQVAKATLAMAQYQDCGNALTDQYGPSSGGVYVSNMGIHISRFNYLSTTFDLEKPFGLVCSEKETGPAGVPDKLIGAWYIIPVDSTCAVYGLGGPCQDSSVQPDGFGVSNNDEDNQDPPGRQSGWHTHINLCVGNGSLVEMFPPNQDWHQHDGVATEDLDGQHECVTHRGGFLNVPIYGWMLHLYNFIPNPDGRFMKWNVNSVLP